MLGFVIGIACGAGELFLLQRFINVMLSGEPLKVGLLVLLKLLVMGVALTAVIVFARQDLVWCGVGITGCLIGGSVISFLRNAGMKGGKN